MKILQVITLSELGGAQSVVIELANSLCQDNEIFVCSSAKGEMWKLLDKRITQIKIKELKRELCFSDIFVWLKLIWINFKFNPDVVHLHSSKIGILGRLAFPKRKLIYTYHGFDGIRIAAAKFLPVERILQYRCSALAGVSEYDKKNCIANGIHNVISIYNGVADTELESNPQVDNAIKILENDRQFKIITIARLSPQKNIKLFLQIASQLPNISFYWVGNGYEYKTDLPNVHFLGMIRNATLLNKYADLHILCSNYEGMPICIIEALRFSIPVVASNVGAISEMLDGNNGFAVNNDAESFCEKILFYFNNKEDYDAACLSARKIYEEKFCSNKMIDEYLNVYNKIAIKQ
jgi:glycosyltransferase involved in cell wall biosynthesis